MISHFRCKFFIIRDIFHHTIQLYRTLNNNFNVNMTHFLNDTSKNAEMCVQAVPFKRNESGVTLIPRGYPAIISPMYITQRTPMRFRM